MQLENLQAEFIEMILTPSHENMKIYQENIIKNMTEALKNTYPLIFNLLGKNLFTELSQYYINFYPSYRNTLHDYGEYFPHFLGKYFSSPYPYLIEIAQFEWMSHVVLHAAIHPPLDTKVMEKIPENQYNTLRFLLHPASALHHFRYPILELIDTCRTKQDQSSITQIKKRNTPLLFMRRKMALTFLELTAAEFNFLWALQDNQSLAQALKTTLSIDSQFKLEEKLTEWIRENIIVDVDLII